MKRAIFNTIGAAAKEFSCALEALGINNDKISRTAKEADSRFDDICLISSITQIGLGTFIELIGKYW